MLLCPIKGAVKISQKFGENPKMYKQFKMKGHNGTDYSVPVGTPVYAPMDGYVQVKDSKEAGYGMHVKIRNEFKALEVVLAHLSRFSVKDGQKIMMGDLIGYSGNTGYSTGAHLHAGTRRLIPSSDPLSGWLVTDYNSGYLGAFDDSEFIINWQ